VLGSDDRFPRPFGDHLLLRRIASGGMADVFEASLTGPGGFEKRVALKRLLAEHRGSVPLVRALIREARLGALLCHPNLCRVDHLGCVDGQWFFTLELVNGVDLHRLTARFRRHGVPVPLELVLHVGAQICAGLHHAHDARDPRGRPLRVVHRDVSPQNVLVGRDGTVKVVDFGIARTGLRRNRTARGVIKGKWAYMSPEQARGGRLDRRSDVYALGVLLYELLTGALPPSADAVRGGRRPRPPDLPRPRTADPPAIQRDVAGLPRELAAAVDRCLAEDPGDRFPTAERLGDVLGECLHRRFPRFTGGRAAALLDAVASELVTPPTPPHPAVAPPADTVVTARDRPAPIRPRRRPRNGTPTESITPRPLAALPDPADDETLVVDTAILEALRIDLSPAVPPR